MKKSKSPKKPLTWIAIVDGLSYLVEDGSETARAAALSAITTAKAEGRLKEAAEVLVTVLPAEPCVQFKMTLNLKQTYP